MTKQHETPQNAKRPFDRLVMLRCIGNGVYYKGLYKWRNIVPISDAVKWVRGMKNTHSTWLAWYETV